LPNPAGKKLCLFKDRRADLLKVVSAKHITHHTFDVVPQRRFRREKIARSSDSFNHSGLSCQLPVLSCQQILKECHPERSEIIRFANDLTESKDLVFFLNC